MTTLKTPTTKRSLRRQLLWSHLALVGLMGVLMVGAVISFFRLGRSIDRILRDNYKSVVAAQTMKEALERIDSSATFVLAGQREKARTQYARNRPIFTGALQTERGNITESGERAVANDITTRFEAYSGAVERLLNHDLPAAQQRQLYFGTLEPGFLGLKGRVQQVLDLNQAAMRRRDAQAKAEAQRATWFGFAVTLGALGLAVAFARRAINASLTPLVALTQAAQEVGAGHLNRRIELERADEIGTLADAFNDMASKLRVARKVEEQRLHRAQRMSDAALESLYDPVLVSDATGHVVHLNHAAEALFGPANRASGSPVAQVVADPRLSSVVEQAAKYNLAFTEEGERAFVTLPVGDESRIYRLRATPMTDDDGTLLGAALVLEDVTKLRELDRLKTEFIGVASHELRTPVTSLMLSAQLLDEGAVGALTDDQREVVKAQREDLARLDRMMRDLLDLTKLEAGTTPPRLEPVAPRELVEAACASVAAQARHKGINLEAVIAPDLPPVAADRAQIGRVLTNLLNNAVRHTPEGGIVGLEAERAEGGVLLRAFDNGMGIPKEYLPRIFDRFTQVPGATRGGAGLGLSIARTLVRSHGSDLTVQSAPGEGSTFEFVLSRALPDDSTRAGSAASERTVTATAERAATNEPGKASAPNAAPSPTTTHTQDKAESQGDTNGTRAGD